MTPLLSLFLRFYKGRALYEGTTGRRGFSLSLNGVSLLIDTRAGTLTENGPEYAETGSRWNQLDIRVKRDADIVVTSPAWYEKLAALVLVWLVHRTAIKNTRQAEREKILGATTTAP